MSDTAQPVLSYIDQNDFLAMVQQLAQTIARGRW